MSRDVFISHSSQSSTTASAIAEQLERNGIRCWMAPRDLDPGSEWAEGIIDGIEECPLFLLILCPHANNSPQVLREAERAVNKKKPIIPIIIGKFALSKSLEYFVSSHHWLEFSKQNNREQLRALIAIIKKKLSGQDDSAPLRLAEEVLDKQPFFARKSVLAGLLIIPAAGLMLWFLASVFLHHTFAPPVKVAVPAGQSAKKAGAKEMLGADALEGEVFAVPNGNGVKARVNGKEVEIRLYGIDAPAPQQEYSVTAQRFLEQLVADRKIRVNLLGTDDHGHTLAFAVSGGKMLNKEMVQAGYAWKNPKHCQQEPFCSELGQLEQKARTERLGLWQGDNPVPPWEWFRQRAASSSAAAPPPPEEAAEPADQSAKDGR